MPAIVKKDTPSNWLIRHCHTSKYKNGPVVGMRVPLYPLVVHSEPHYNGDGAFHL